MMRPRTLRVYSLVALAAFTGSSIARAEGSPPAGTQNPAAVTDIDDPGITPPRGAVTDDDTPPKLPPAAPKPLPVPAARPYPSAPPPGHPYPRYPSAQPWTRGQPTTSPNGYPTTWRRPEPEKRDPWKLFTVGAVAFTGVWAATALFGGFLAKEGWFAMPIAGPIVWASQQNGSDQGLLIAYMSLFVTGPQLATAGIMFGGLAKALKAPAQVTLVPVVSPSFAGLSAGGSF